MAARPSATTSEGAARPRRTGTADERIRRELLDAIVDHRIPPGTALPEDSLAGAFGVSRTVVRKALQSLGHEKLVELRPSRGAIVARPSAEEARQVFEARRVVEAAVASAAAGRGGRDRRLAAIRARLADETVAEQAGDRRAGIRLSGDFHRDLAATAGNDVLAGFLGELISRTSLILALYQRQGEPPCSHGDHAAILDAVARGDAEDARGRMVEHLERIERQLDLGDAPAAVDLQALFAHARGGAKAST